MKPHSPSIPGPGVFRVQFAEAVVDPIPEDGTLPNWFLMRPIPENFNGKHPAITPEMLQQIADDYDPKLDIAAIDYDHLEWGPAAGRIGTVSVSDGNLHVQPALITPAARTKIKDGEYFRLSAEIAFQHPVTGRAYLTAVALLGAKKPAILGQDPIALADQKSKEKQLAQPMEEIVGDEEKENTRLEALEKSNLQLQRELAAERHARTVDAQLSKYKDRLTPEAFQIAASLALELMPSTGKIKLTGSNGPVEVDHAQALFALLAALPPSVVAGQLATTDQDKPKVILSAQQAKTNAELGISDQEAAELQKKYPGSFKA